MAAAQQAASLCMACAPYLENRSGPMNRMNLLALAAVIGCAGSGAQRLETPVPDDEVSVGYGTQLKRNTTGAVSSVTPTDADARFARVEEMLLARVPGLEVVRLARGRYTLRRRGPACWAPTLTFSVVADYQRRRTAVVSVGVGKVGSAYPIVVQSMTNTDTADIAATAAQVRALHAAGSELVRVTVNNEAAADAVPHIVAQVDVPVIGDFHYNGHLLLTRYPHCARALAKYRINPGNVGAKRRDEHFRTIIEVALANDRPVRIGVNWGSLDQQLLTELMDANAPRPER